MFKSISSVIIKIRRGWFKDKKKLYSKEGTNFFLSTYINFIGNLMKYTWKTKKKKIINYFFGQF